MRRTNDNTVDRTRKYNYGITAAEYHGLVKQQNGKCAVCGNGETQMDRNGKIRNLGVDHCHRTGKIRGLLCHNCNVALGHAQDDPAMLRRMAAYLEVADTGYVAPWRDNARAVSTGPIPDADDLLNEMNQP